MTAHTSTLAGSVAIVTGGASGIGAAVSARLRADGAHVAVFDRTVPDSGDERAFEVDVTDDDAVRRAVAAVVERFGRIDILVNNAGVGAQGDVSAQTDEQWHRVLDVNVVGIARVSRAVLPYLRHSPAAAIVNMCSIAAGTGLPARAAYSASKGAVLSLTRAMAADHLPDGIRVNSVSPGTADTPWVQRLLDASPDADAERAALEARQPHGRLVSPDEVADAVAYLVGPRAASTTGVDLAVDGGMAAVRLRTGR